MGWKQDRNGQGKGGRGGETGKGQGVVGQLRRFRCHYFFFTRVFISWVMPRLGYTHIHYSPAQASEVRAWSGLMRWTVSKGGIRYVSTCNTEREQLNASTGSQQRQNREKEGGVSMRLRTIAQQPPGPSQACLSMTGRLRLRQHIVRSPPPFPPVPFRTHKSCLTVCWRARGGEDSVSDPSVSSFLANGSCLRSLQGGSGYVRRMGEGGRGIVVMMPSLERRGGERRSW